MPHNRDMDRDFPAALIPLAVVMVGLDWVSGWPVLYTYILPFLHQIGF